MTGRTSQPGASARRLVVILGQMPPPVTGAAKNTALMIEEARAAGAEVIPLSTGSGETALQRSVRYHLRRLNHAWATLRRVRAATRAPADTRTLYLVPDGGLGLWYMYFYLRAGSSGFARVLLHHRSFGYIDTKSPPMERIIALLGKRATHIFLSEGQRDAFARQYGPQDAMISTNALYVVPRRPTKRVGVLTIGHLSNLCELKGFYDVIGTFEAAVAAGLPVRLMLAGPPVEPGVQEAIDNLSAKYPGQVEALGSVGGEVKDRFYDQLDVFLFPTRWPQEAQPNVVYEAFAGGAYNIAFGRGSITEMIPPHLGLVIPQGGDFAGRAVAYLERLWRDERDAAPRVEAVHAWLVDEVASSAAQRRAMIAAVVGEKSAAAEPARA